MDNLKAIAAWQKWASKTDNCAGDVTVPDSPDVSFWFLEAHQAAAAPHFHRFADAGDSSLVALWSAEGGAFEHAPVVVLGHEGEVCALARSAAEAIALFAASDNFEMLWACGEAGEPDPELSDFVATTFGLSVPEGFERDPVLQKKFATFMKDLTGQDYSS